MQFENQATRLINIHNTFANELTRNYARRWYASKGNTREAPEGDRNMYLDGPDG
jgi:hypothetical protein